MDANEISALLGRPLTTVETTNFDLYLKIANESLEQLICTAYCDDSDPKTYTARAGYTTQFTDIFTDVDEVTIDGTTIDESDYSLRQWNRANASWYNSIVFNRKLVKGEEISVSASWGFDKLPSDLKLVIAGLFDLITKKNKADGSVQSKQVEDFRITFNADVDLDTEFYTKYHKILSKYSLCDIGNVQSGVIDCGC